MIILSCPHPTCSDTLGAEAPARRETAQTGREAAGLVADRQPATRATEGWRRVSKASPDAPEARTVTIGVLTKMTIAGRASHKVLQTTGFSITSDQKSRGGAEISRAVTRWKLDRRGHQVDRLEGAEISRAVTRWKPLRGPGGLGSKGAEISRAVTRWKPS